VTLSARPGVGLGLSTSSSLPEGKRSREWPSETSGPCGPYEVSSPYETALITLPAPSSRIRWSPSLFSPLPIAPSGTKNIVPSNSGKFVRKPSSVAAITAKLWGERENSGRRSLPELSPMLQPLRAIVSSVALNSSSHSKEASEPLWIGLY